PMTGATPSSTALPPARRGRLSRLWRAASENPRYVGMRTLARFDWIRQAVSGMHGLTHRSAARLGEQQAAASLSSTRVELDPAIGLDAFLERLRSDGVALGLRLQAEDVQAIHAY